MIKTASARFIGSCVGEPLKRSAANQMNRILFLVLLMLIVVASPAVAQKISHDELVEILEIKSWRIPMPKDESFEWS
ncbi:MAG TPA: hypothetical protein VKB46_18050 [Pyrinomonadaceae bacterium]|nr:hypothetical protein [Pyrinomonadaceae bacterium]